MSIDPLSSNAFAQLQTIRSSAEQKPSMLRQAFNQALEAAQKGNDTTSIGAVQAMEILKLAQLQLVQGLFVADEDSGREADMFSLLGWEPSVAPAASQNVDSAYAKLQASPLEPEKGSRNAIEQLIEQVADEVRLAPALIRSVVAAESNFQPNAVSAAGAQGLMQLMPATAQELGVADSFDPQQNLRGGARYLRQLLDKYAGDLDRTLAAYNWGQGNVDRKGLQQMPQETRDYLLKVKAQLVRQA